MASDAFIAGTPLYFHPSCDPDNKIFEKYLHLDAPTVMFIPGVPQFRTEALDDTDYENMQTTDNRYYTFNSDITQYKEYLKTMITTCAPSDKIANYGGLASMLAGACQITEGATSILLRANKISAPSEEISNSFAESQVASAVKSISQQAQDINFLAKVENNDNAITNKISSLTDSASNVIGNILGNVGNDFSDLGKSISSSIKGTNLTYPDLWRDSSFSKSMSINFEFVSPYGDPDSIYYHCILPLLELIALAAPRQTGVNAYTSPFLVHCEIPGYFVTDVGVITSLSWKRGGSDGCFSSCGLPLSISASVTVKDLYPILMLSKSTTYLKQCNVGTAHFLRNLVGLNLRSVTGSIISDVNGLFANLATIGTQAIDKTCDWFKDGYNTWISTHTNL
jgi:hypothetical protein